jgi:hypothetical protein
MKLPRDVSGERLANVLCRKWDYVRIHQSGSHLILETEQPAHHRISGHKGVSREDILSGL